MLKEALGMGIIGAGTLWVTAVPIWILKLGWRWVKWTLVLGPSG
jgi:hypothetical protein